MYQPLFCFSYTSLFYTDIIQNRPEKSALSTSRDSTQYNLLPLAASVPVGHQRRREIITFIEVLTAPGRIFFSFQWYTAPVSCTYSQRREEENRVTSLSTLSALEYISWVGFIFLPPSASFPSSCFASHAWQLAHAASALWPHFRRKRSRGQTL